MPDRSVLVPDCAAMERAGQALGHALGAMPRAPHADGAVVVGLSGSLGAGKTTLARASLRALGVEGTVRSPTYTIAEPYETRIGRIWHLDLYRIASPHDLEYIAVRDLVSESAACLIEWPERGAGAMSKLDCSVTIAVAGHGRRVRIECFTSRGRDVGSRAMASMSRGLEGEGSPET